MTDTKFTIGPLESRVVYGWGDTPCVIAVGSDKPIANFIRPNDYYTEYVKRVDENGEEWSVLSDESAKKAGNYVPTKEHKRAVEEEQMATARLFAAAPELYEFAEEHEKFEADIILNSDWSDEFPKLTEQQWQWFMRLQAMRNAALAKARGEQ